MPGLLQPTLDDLPDPSPQTSPAKLHVPATIQLPPHAGDFRDDLARDGFAIIRGAVPPERAEQYRQRAFQWIENWTLGFKRDDPSTWKPDNVPVVAKGGMFHHSIGQEAFLWDLRQEPGVVNAFAKLWGTDELLVSFDGANVSLPGEMQNFKHVPWYHVDQNPVRRGFICAQGVINLNDNGPDDGGLILLKRSNTFNEKFVSEVWDGVDGYIPTGENAQPDFFGFSAKINAWFEEQGCEWVKPSLNAGDLVIWDSRTAHYNVPPKGTRDRVAAYACYAPAKLCDPEQLKLKQDIFKASKMTTHWPCQNMHVKSPVVLRDGKQCPHTQFIPFEKPEQTDKLLKLAGMVPY